MPLTKYLRFFGNMGIVMLVFSAVKAFPVNQFHTKRQLGAGNYDSMKSTKVRDLDVKVKPSKPIIATQLPGFLKEISGHCLSEQGLWMINDGGNTPTLFYLKMEDYRKWRDSGMALSDSLFWGFELPLINQDWEAIETDGQYLYIGDFGNNLGTRRDLRIYKLLISNLILARNNYVSHQTYFENRSNDSLLSRDIKTIKAYKSLYQSIALDTTFLITLINFSYENQNCFKARRLHAFDCEAIIIEQDRILLFTKNWNNLKSTIYSVPKIEGNYTAKKISTFCASYLVTDADVDDSLVYLCGYSYTGNQYIGSISKTTFTQFRKQKISLKPAQIEGILWDKEIQGWILSTESRKAQAQALIKLGSYHHR